MYNNFDNLRMMLTIEHDYYRVDWESESSAADLGLGLFHRLCGVNVDITIARIYFPSCCVLTMLGRSDVERTCPAYMAACGGAVVWLCRVE
jgi:hypothetical protein